VHIDMNVPIDPLAPVLTGPDDGYHYAVWTPLTLSWTGNPGTDGKFYLEVKLDGVTFLPFNNLAIPKNSVTLPAFQVDKLAKYGTWEWRVYVLSAGSPPVKHYSPWRTIYKDPAEVLTPDDGAVVDPSTEFTWNKVESDKPGDTFYIVKVTGIPGADPLYVWWNDADHATLPPNWYQILKNTGETSFTWAVAAVRGDPSTPGGTGMTMQYATAVKYPAARTFHVE
jgi:hypothetical protein